MSQPLEALPLFPLHAVLFPFAQMQLHVSEPRYRELVATCVNDGVPFGVVLIRTESDGGRHIEPYLVGTVVRIVNIHHFEGGEMDVHVMGERRFRIRGFEDGHDFMVGKVEPLEEADIAGDDAALKVVNRAREVFEGLVERVLRKQDFAVHVVFPPDATALSFAVANMLPLEDLEKQRLLETTDTIERLEELIPHLELQLASVQTPQFVRLTPNDLREWIHPN